MIRYTELEQLLFTGVEADIQLALRRGEIQGIDLKPKLRQLQEIVSFMEKHKKEAYSIGKLMHEIEHRGLDLSGLKLEELPRFFGVLADYCQQINLSNNLLKEFPTVLLSYSKLKVLNLSANQFIRLSDSCCQAYEKLEYLDLTKNPLKLISAKIGSLKNLKSLKISHQKKLQIPVEILELEQLRHLSIEKSDQAPIDPIFFALDQLESLSLKGFCNAQISNWQLGQLSSLRSLQLVNWWQSREVPYPVYQLKELESLQLDASSFEQIASSIRQLKKLQMLSLCKTGIIPQSAERWQERLSLWLPDCEITWA